MLKSVIITVEKSELGKLPAVSNRLKTHGLRVGSVLPFGVITGHIEENLMESLRQDDAVRSVAEESYIQLPPPDSAVQ